MRQLIGRGAEFDALTRGRLTSVSAIDVECGRVAFATLDALGLAVARLAEWQRRVAHSRWSAYLIARQPCVAKNRVAATSARTFPQETIYTGRFTSPSREAASSS